MLTRSFILFHSFKLKFVPFWFGTIPSSVWRPLTLYFEAVSSSAQRTLVCLAYTCRTCTPVLWAISSGSNATFFLRVPITYRQKGNYALFSFGFGAILSSVLGLFLVLCVGITVGGTWENPMKQSWSNHLICYTISRAHLCKVAMLISMLMEIST